MKNLIILMLFLVSTTLYSQRTQKYNGRTIHVDGKVKGKTDSPKSNSRVEFERHEHGGPDGNRSTGNGSSSNSGYKARGNRKYLNATYTGETYNGKENGKGAIAYKHGGYFIGDFKNGSFIKGYGKMNVLGGVYNGQISRNKKGQGLVQNGNGKLFKANGEILNGKFINNSFVSGQAKFKYGNGVYQGEAKSINGKIVRHGKGVYFFNNGNKFSGIYNHDKRVKGRYTSKNGITKVGSWSKDGFKGKTLLDLTKLSKQSMDALKEFDNMKDLANTLYKVTAFAPLVTTFTQGTDWRVPKGTEISKRNILAFTKEGSSVANTGGQWVALARASKGLNSITRAKFIQFCEKQMLKHKNQPLDYRFWKKMRKSFY